MAKLSQKRARRLAFVASKLALSIDQDERMALLTELLDELGITDAEQREDSKESAARHLRYTAQQRRKAARQADDIDNMKRDELQDYIKQLYARRDELLAQRAEQPTPAPAPDPAPTVEEAPTYDVTAKQRRALAAFDDMSDADQVDALQQMWGPA